MLGCGASPGCVAPLTTITVTTKPLMPFTPLALAISVIAILLVFRKAK
ncbi:MAG: hypothetical protein JZD40_01005 [Sulfolobus sp.]|nr:hypothetical protein [Sulfolobus sp.]